MFSKTNLLATITGGIAMFLLGYLIWGMAMVSFFESHSLNNIMKDPPAIGLIFIANLIQAFAMSTLIISGQVAPTLPKMVLNLGHGLEYL